MRFSVDEYHARVAKAQAAMAHEEIAALLLTTEPDFRYFSGFLTRFWESPTRPWYLIIPASGEPVAVIPSIGAELMQATWVKDIRTWQSPDYDDDGVSLLADAIRGLTSAGTRIGVPMGRESALRMPLADYARLQTLLGARRVIDAAALLRRLQCVKSHDEIEAIRAICGVAGRAFDRVPEIAQAGKPLSQVFREFQMALLDEGAEWVSYLAGGAGVGGYGDVISPASDRPLATGDLLMLDTGAVKAGYFCDFDRNWAIGAATPAMLDAHRALHDSIDAGFDAARPRATPSDLSRAIAKSVEQSGFASAGGRLGHGLGMRLTEPPSLIPADDTPLEPGMVLTLEPSAVLAPGRIMVQEEVIVVRENGAEWLTPRAPRELPIIGGAS